jgi:hypothetical protein
LRVVMGITENGSIEPLGCFTNTHWSEIENNIKTRIKEAKGSRKNKFTFS